MQAGFQSKFIRRSLANWKSWSANRAMITWRGSSPLGQHGLELKEIQITSDTGSSGSSTAEGSRSDAGEHQERENLGDQNERNDRSQRTNFSLPTAKADFHHSVNGLTGNRQVNLLV
jgi:hypothetical protein